jgi:hypothetical protein
VQVGLAAAVVAQHAQRLGMRSLLRSHQAGIADRGKVLGRIEREACEVAPAAAAPAVVIRAEGLRAILDEYQPVFFTDRGDPVQGG